eukprot:TRINITY_DN13650_c0_g1_i2.p1 TRINITY_DN13650_c0_g1~~TRINITY_DN13650_c0_g1_i2.p1  ORF type:complete len:208 (-),score=27.70 TRINITY_DN13650_c0_g1_i2:248-871(-)
MRFPSPTNREHLSNLFFLVCKFLFFCNLCCCSQLNFQMIRMTSSCSDNVVLPDIQRPTCNQEPRYQIHKIFLCIDKGTPRISMCHVGNPVQEFFSPTLENHKYFNTITKHLLHLPAKVAKKCSKVNGGKWGLHNEDRKPKSYSIAISLWAFTVVLDTFHKAGLGNKNKQKNISVDPLFNFLVRSFCSTCTNVMVTVNLIWKPVPWFH